MLSFLAIKTNIKKAWVWLKHNWHVPVIVIYTLTLWIIFRDKSKALEILEIRSNSYKKQIKAIEEIHKEEIDKRNEILKKYNGILATLEEDYEKKNMLLDRKKKEEVKKLVEDYNEKPDELAKLLAERYGLEYVE
jgi:hypothetical protein